jgi:hypothetical protein
MFISSMELDDRDCREFLPTLSELSLDGVEAAIVGSAPIEDTGTDRWSTVTLFGPGSTRLMSIGKSSEKGRFTCRVWDDELGEQILCDPSQPADKLVKVMLGGVVDGTLARWTAPEAEVVKAARRFALDGSLEPTLPWEDPFQAV